MESDTAKKSSLIEELKRLLPGPAAQAAWLIMGAAFLWFYWYEILHLLRVWENSEDYQHGFFVPLFSLFLLWLRRDMIKDVAGPVRGHWWGLVLLALAALMRWVAVYYNFGSLPEMSIVPFFAGVALFVGGWQGLRWAWPAVLFLVFMIPLPGAVQGFASTQLQAIATRISTFIIQTLGIPSIAYGNVIQLTDKPLEVARACSGLRMMMLFFALCIGAAFVVQRPLWEKLVMIASAAPIAVLSNVIRIVMTAVVYEFAGRWPDVIDVETAGEIIHQWAGYLMMPVGLLLLMAEMALLSKLLIEPVTDKPLVIGQMMATSEPEAIMPRPQRRRRG